MNRTLYHFIAVLIFGYIGIFSAYAGVGAVLVPYRVGQLDPNGKLYDMAVLAALSGVFGVISNPLAGRFSDQKASRGLSRAPLLWSGAIGAIAATATLSRSHSLAWIYLGQLTLVVVVNVFQSVLTGLIPHQVPSNKRGLASAAIGIATVAGTVVGTQLAAKYGTSSVSFVAPGVLLALGAAIANPFVRRSVGLNSSAGDRAGRGSAATQMRRFFAAFGDSSFAWMFAGRALMALSYNLIFVYLVFVVEDYVRVPGKLSPTAAVAQLTLISALFGAVATIASGLLADRVRKFRGFVFVSGICGAAALLTPVFFRSWTSALVFAGWEGASLGVFLAVDTALVTLILPSSSDAARDFGLQNTASAAPAVVAPFLASLIVLTAGYPALFIVAAMCALASALTIIRVRVTV